jgi:hypothetical protein
MAHNKEEWVTFDDIDEPEADTDLAILVYVEGKKVWIPKSQIHEDSEVYTSGTSGKLIITEWIASQKGLV